MIHCPSIETLVRLLAAELPEPDAGAVREHLACCTQCQAALVRMSHDDELDQWRTRRATGLSISGCSMS